jgi:hypothetical protein
MTLLSEHQDALRSRFGIDQADVWADPGPWRHWHGVAGRDDRFAYIHATKMDPRLVDGLTEASLAARGRDGNPDWIAVHPKLAQVYMTALADDVATRKGVHPVTDDATHYEAIGGWSVDRIGRSLLELPDEGGAKDVVVSLAFMSVEAVMPANVGSVGVDRILEVRTQYRHEMLAFQDTMANFADELATLASVQEPADFMTHLRLEHETRIAPELEALKRSLKVFKLDAVPTALGVKLAAPAVAAAATQYGFEDPAVTGVTGAAFGLLTLRQTRQARISAEMKASPAAYLLQVEEGLTPGNLLTRASRRTRKIVTGA